MRTRLSPMTFRKTISALVLLAALTIAATLPGNALHVRAQAVPVEIGRSFKGEFKPDQLQLSFTFKGKTNDWVVIEFRLPESTFKGTPTFRVRLEADDIINSSVYPGQTAEGLIQLPKDGDYVIDVLPPVGVDTGTFIARIVKPATLENGKAVTAGYAPEPLWFMMSSNGPFSLLYSTQDAAGLKPLLLSGVVNSGNKIPSGYLKLALTTDNTVGGDPDFGTFRSLTLAYNPKPAAAIYLVRVGSIKPGNYAFTLLRTDEKK